MRLDSAPDALTARPSTTRGRDPLSVRRLRQSTYVNIGVLPMKKLLAALIAALSFLRRCVDAADAAKAQSARSRPPKTARKPKTPERN